MNMKMNVNMIRLALAITMLGTLGRGLQSFNVVEYGAIADGKTDSTAAFSGAWDKVCLSKSPAIFYVPGGKFLLKGVEFSGPCNNRNILVRMEGTLVAPSDYKGLGGSDYWILFKNVDGVTISGGVLDGQGSSLWACKDGSGKCPAGARALTFQRSSNIEINGLTSLNSQLFHIVFGHCRNVKVSNVKVSAPGNSPNTDGIHVQSSSGVTIVNSKAGTGDDCVSVGPGVRDLWIENFECGPGHGISLGKYTTEDGVQNVTVKSVTFTNSDNGVRIKSWGRPTTGFANNILFQHIAMNNVRNPIIIDQNYCPHSLNCPGQASGVKISNVRYQDIHGSSASQIAVNFQCSSKNPCTGISLQDIDLVYKNGISKSACNNVVGMHSGQLQPPSCF